MLYKGSSRAGPVGVQKEAQHVGAAKLAGTSTAHPPQQEKCVRMREDSVPLLLRCLLQHLRASAAACSCNSPEVRAETVEEAGRVVGPVLSAVQGAPGKLSHALSRSLPCPSTSQLLCAVQRSQQVVLSPGIAVSAAGQS